MTSKKLRDVFIRAIGIFELGRGLVQLPVHFWNFYYADDTHMLVSGARTVLSYGIGQILMGAVLFFGAGWIVQKAYPDPIPDEQETD